MEIDKRQMLAAGGLGLASSFAMASAASPNIGQNAADGEVSFATWQAVNNVVQRYADCVDRFDLEGLQAIFAPDGVYDYAPGMLLKGRDAIAEGARKALANVSRSHHFVGAPVVGPGDQPGNYVSHTYFTAVHEHKNGGGHTAYGRYLDTFMPDPLGRLLINYRRTVTHLAENMNSPRYWLDREPS